MDNVERQNEVLSVIRDMEVQVARSQYQFIGERIRSSKKSNIEDTAIKINELKWLVVTGMTKDEYIKSVFKRYNCKPK